MNNDWTDVLAECIRTIVALLVDHPDDVEVNVSSYPNTSNNSMRYVFSIKTNVADIPTVVGKKGGAIKSIRSIVGRIAKKNGASYALVKIVE